MYRHGAIRADRGIFYSCRLLSWWFQVLKLGCLFFGGLAFLQVNSDGFFRDTGRSVRDLIDIVIAEGVYQASAARLYENSAGTPELEE
jgi:hypothetical protein